MERTKKEGTFDLDFEFNQEPWDGSSGGPTRTPGDLVVGFELKGNPRDRQQDLQVLIAQFYEPGEGPSLCKVTPGTGNEPALVEVGDEPCPPYGDSGWHYRVLSDGAVLSESGLGQATMNDEPFPAPWESTDAQGNPRTEIGMFQFAEAALNLTDLGIEAECSTFSTVHAKSRSSLEVESDLKDLAGPIPLEIMCRLDGHKFLDVNGNGSWDKPDEPPLEGWKITLSDGSETFTDADGYYEFEGLKDGTYTVQEVCPESWVQSAPGFTDFDTCGDEVYTVEINLQNREENDLDFGNGQPELDLTKVCPADVFVGDDIEYEITVTNTGNVFLEGIVVEDPVIGLNETVELEPDESKTFTATIIASSAGALGDGRYRVYLPLVIHGTGSNLAANTPLADDITNTATASAEYALATVTASDDCVTKVHELDVSKDAQTSLTRTYLWTIDKTVDDPGPIILLPGGSTTAQYTVTVDLDSPPYTDSDWAVEGSITVDNPAPMDAELASVTDMVSPGTAATVNCPSLIVPAGGSLTCTYGPVQLPDGTDRTNTATATLKNNNGGTTGFSGSAQVDFSQATMNLIDEEVEVFDDFWDLPTDTLGTVRYDEVPATFTYSRDITAPGSICQLFEVANEAFLVTNDTGTRIEDDAGVQVQILELCEVAFGFEDLPNSPGNLDWDYNDWMTSVELDPTYADTSPGAELVSIDFAVQPEARGAAYDHAFSLTIPQDEFACDGTYTMNRFDAGGNLVFTDSGDFDASAGDEFELFPFTSDVLPQLSNTDETKPYDTPQRSASLSIVFDEPCPFEPGAFDPVAAIHGDGLFFGASLFVHDTGETVGVGDVRTLLVPVQWLWPQERIPVWLAYPGVQAGEPPTFPWAWWEEWTELVYEGKP
jgi:hypothetical protein